MKPLIVFMICIATAGTNVSRAQVSDASDAFWSIVMPGATGTAVDMGQAQIGSVEDSVVAGFLRNTGPVDIRIDSIFFSGANANAFSLVSGIPPFLIPQGGQKAVEFRFTPQAIGVSVSTITIFTQIDTLSYGIRGEGIAPMLEAATTLIDFGQVNISAVKDTSPPAVLRNIGNAPVNISGVTLLGPDTSQFSILAGGGSFTLAAGRSQPMQLRFAPAQSGRTSGRIGFYYNGAGSPLIVDLFGEGIGVQGFATIQIDTIRAKPGEPAEVPISLRNAQNLNLTGATGFYSELSFDESLLSPLGGTPKGTTANGKRTIVLDNLPLQAGADGTLAKLQFIAMLGEREGTQLLLENTFAINGNVRVTTAPGYFLLLGVCHEGGARLFQSTGKMSLLQNRPNPFNATTLIEYEVIESGPARLTVTDFLGRTVATLVDGDVTAGKYTAVFDASMLASGTYFYILQTPTMRTSGLMEVLK